MAQGDVLNMSLDDIIKQKGSGPRKQDRKKDDRRGAKRYEEGLKVTVKGSNRRGAGLGKQRSAGRVLEVPIGDLSMAQEAPPRNAAALDGDAAWEHDLYQEGPRTNSRRLRPAVDGFKLVITNLDFKVTDEDIQELFENCGAIKKAGVMYDRSGRSEEAAEVIFERREDAMAAVRKYNNLQLDNKPMKIQLIEGGAGGGGGSRTLASGIRIGSGQRAVGLSQSGGRSGRGSFKSRPQAGPRRGGRGGDGGGGGGGSRRPRGRGAVVSQDDLDKDLDSYMATD